jgi:uncharacterized membrane protein
MVILVLGLVIFLGLHSTRVFAESLRANAIARLGEGAWKGTYSLLSIIGFFLIVLGFAQARWNVVELWTPPVWTRQTTILLMLFSAILMAAYIFKKSHIAVAARHPMLWSVAIWAAGHLLSNGSSADLVLFGAFFVWAVADLRSSYARDQRNAVAYPAPNWGATFDGRLHLDRPSRGPAPVAVWRGADGDVTAGEGSGFSRRRARLRRTTLVLLSRDRVLALKPDEAGLLRLLQQGSSATRLLVDRLQYRILLDVTPQVRPPVLEVENLSRRVWLGVLLQRDELHILLGPDELARVVKYFSFQLDGLVLVVVVPDRVPVQRLGDVRIGLLLALEEGEEEVRVPLLPVADRVDGHLEEQREVLVRRSLATELFDLLCVLWLEQSSLASALLLLDYRTLTVGYPQPPLFRDPN